MLLRLAGPMRWRLRGAADRLQHALFPPDPGAFRLIGAIRATVGGLLALALCMAARGVLPMPFITRLLAFAIAMFLGGVVRDATRAGQAVTIAVSPLPVLAAVVLAALALRVTLFPELLTVALVFVATCLAALGPRWAALGAVSLIGLLVALLSDVTPRELPSWGVALICAAVGSLVVRFVLLPDPRADQLLRLRRAIRSGIVDVLRGIEAALDQGGWRSGDRRRLRRTLARLSDAVMLALPLLAPKSALHLMECDLITERVARVALLNLGPDAERPALRAHVEALRRAVADELAPPAPAAQPGSMLGGVLAVMALAFAQPIPAGPPAVAAPPGAAPSFWRRSFWTRVDLRSGVQAAVATVLAIIGGAAVSSHRWYWAVFSAYVLFQGTRSRGESIAKAVEMLVGTVAGVVVGVLVATLLAGHTVLSMIAVIAAVFLAFLASSAAYGVMIFWITIILGLVFGMIGYFPPSLLLLRLKETAVGAAAGIVVAWVVLARPTPDLIRSCAAGFLQALGPVVRAAMGPLLNQPAGETLPDLAVTLEQRYQALRVATAPQIARSRLLGPDRNRLPLLLGACEEWARDMVQTSLHLAPRADHALAVAARQAASRIEATIADLVGRLTGTRSASAVIPVEPGAVAAIPEGNDPAIHLARLLLRLDAALLHLRQRLAGG